MKRVWAIGALLLVSSCTGAALDTTTTEATTTTNEFATTTTTAAASSTSVPTTTTTTTTTPLPTTTTTQPPPLDTVQVGLQWVVGGFDAPLFVLSRASADGAAGDNRLFVVDQTGTISAFVPPAPGEDARPTVVLDISDKVAYGGERGLLGAAFHPKSPDRLFVDYTRASDGATVVQEYSFPVGADAADPVPVRTLLVQKQPAANHNGGMLVFGPDDRLYISLGDGGGEGDRYGSGQDPTTLLGTILRIDVDAGTPYAIPADNPFADGVDGAPEVWLWGLRNPWRFTFDGDTMWIADVGQDAWEEIDVVTPDQGGDNFGWPIFEGTHCYNGPCDDPGAFHMPVFEYRHAHKRCSITGGYVYRGNAYPALQGAYVFGDYCTGEIGVLRYANGSVTDSRFYDPNVGQLTSFGLDRDGNLYATAYDSIYRVVVTG